MKKFKKLLMFLFVFGLIVFADSITASAVDITEGDNIIPGSGTWANFTWTVDGEGTLTISGQGTMDTNESQEWSAYKHVIEKVVIGEGITNIKDSLFEDYKINMPPSIEEKKNAVFGEF